MSYKPITKRGCLYIINLIKNSPFINYVDSDMTLTTPGNSLKAGKSDDMFVYN